MIIDLSHPGLFPPVYIPLFSIKKRTKIIIGSRGSAKSDFVACYMVMLCLSSKPNKFKCLMVRRAKAAVKQSIYETIKNVIRRWKIEHLFRFYGGEGGGAISIVCLHNGNKFLPLGTNEVGGNSGTAKSVANPTHLLFDEADEGTESEYLKLTMSLRGTDYVEEFLMLNPPEEGHWIIKRWFPEKEKFELPDGSHTYIKSTYSNAVCLHTTYKHNPFLSESEREMFEVLRVNDFENYKSAGLGLLAMTKTGGEALSHFSYNKHVFLTDLFDSERRILECWDFNRLPHHTVGLWSFSYDSTANVFYADLVKEFVEEGMDVVQVQKEINTWLKKNNYKPKKIRLIGDYNGTHQRDSGADTFLAKIEREITNGGFDAINETIPNPSVVSSLDFLNDILAERVFMSPHSGYEGANVQIRISASAVYHVADFQKTKAAADGQLVKMTKTKTVKDGDAVKKVKYQVRGHAVDEARYAMVGVLDSEYYEHRKKK